VVSLPSVHTGGELVIDHAGETAAYRASRDELTLVAFYADCRHQGHAGHVRIPGDAHVHVHSQIDSAALPVRHETRRQGRPYTLELTKTDELFTRETNARHQAETDLAWLTSTQDEPT